MLPFMPSPLRDAAERPALAADVGGGWISHGALAEKIQRLRQHLVGADKGLVFCLAPSSAAGALAYLTAAASGHAVLPLHPATPALDDLIAAYRPEWIIAPPDAAFQTERYQPREWDLPDMRLWRDAKAEAEAAHPDLFLLLLTSGSTGGRKAVRLSHANIASNTAAIIASQGLAAATRALLPLPLAYSFGLSVLHSVLAAGGSVVMTEAGVASRELWTLARERETTLFCGVPYHYETLARLGLDALKAPTLKTFLQAGGRLAPDIAASLLRQIAARDGEFFIMYGQTEAAPRMACLPLHRRPDKLGAVGQVLSGGSFALRDGEVIYTGPNVMMGYAENRADLALGDTQGGALATGDLGQLDDEGFLTLTGRQKRFSKILGQRVALDALEAIASAVAPAAAFAHNDNVIVMTATQDQAALAKMKERLAAMTTLPPACFVLRPVASLCYQANGKLDYQRMEAML